MAEMRSPRSKRSEVGRGAPLDDWEVRPVEKAPEARPSTLRRDPHSRAEDRRRTYSPPDDEPHGSPHDRSPRRHEEASSGRQARDDFGDPRKQHAQPGSAPLSPRTGPSLSPRPSSSGSAPVDPRRRRPRPGPRSSGGGSAPAPPRPAPFTHNVPLPNRAAVSGHTAAAAGDSVPVESGLPRGTGELHHDGGRVESPDAYMRADEDAVEDEFEAAARSACPSDFRHAAEDEPCPTPEPVFFQAAHEHDRFGVGDRSRAAAAAAAAEDHTAEDLSIIRKKGGGNGYPDTVPRSIRAGEEPWQNTPVPAPPVGVFIGGVTLGEEPPPPESTAGVHVRLPLRHQRPPADPDMIARTPPPREQEQPQPDPPQHHAPPPQEHTPAYGAVGAYSDFSHETAAPPPTENPPAAPHAPTNPHPQPAPSSSWFDNQHAVASAHGDVAHGPEGAYQHGVSHLVSGQPHAGQAPPQGESACQPESAQHALHYAQSAQSEAFVVHAVDAGRSAASSDAGCAPAGTTSVSLDFLATPAPDAPAPARPVAVPQQYPVVPHQPSHQPCPPQPGPEQFVPSQQAQWVSGVATSGGSASVGHGQDSGVEVSTGQEWSTFGGAFGGATPHPSSAGDWGSCVGAGAGGSAHASPQGQPWLVPAPAGPDQAGGQVMPGQNADAVGGDRAEGGGAAGAVTAAAVAVAVTATVAATTAAPSPVPPAAGPVHDGVAPAAMAPRPPPLTPERGEDDPQAASAAAPAGTCVPADAVGTQVPAPAAQQRLAPTPLARISWDASELADRFPRCAWVTFPPVFSCSRVLPEWCVERATRECVAHELSSRAP